MATFIAVVLAGGIAALFLVDDDDGRPQALPSPSPSVTFQPSPTDSGTVQPTPTDTGTVEPTASPQATDTPEPSPSPTLEPDDLEGDDNVTDMPVTGIATSIAGGWLVLSSGVLRRWVRRGW